MKCAECGAELVPYKGRYGRKDKAPKVIWVHKGETNHFASYPIQSRKR